jgi:WD40 repeat protein
MPGVFISYSRRDTEFVRRVHDALRTHQYDVWVDWEDIPPSAEWFEEIRAGVAAADGFVYVISPDSVVSEVCTRELDHAATQHKRIVPVLHREPNGRKVPEAAAALNWVFLRDSDDFDAGLERLLAAIETDLEHVRTHTRLGVAAGRWETSSRDKSQLLRGTELAAAEGWLVSSGDKQPEPTQLQREYVLASRQAATRRQRGVIGAVTVALAVAIVLAVVALIQRSTAIHERNVAFARALDAQAVNQYASDPELSLLLATKAAQVDPGSATEEALREALAQSHVRATYDLTSAGAGDALWSPDGTRLLITSPGSGGWARIYTPGAAAASVSIAPPATRGQSAWDGVGDRVLIGGRAPAVFDAATGRLVARLPGPALSVALSRDGGRAVITDARSVAHVLEVATGRQLASFTPPRRGGVTCLAWAPDDSLVAQCDSSSGAGADVGASLDTWQPGTGRLLGSVPSQHLIGTVAFSPDARRYVFTTTRSAAQQSQLALARAAGASGTFVYDARSGRLVIAFPGSASAATFSSQGDEVAYATVGDDFGHVYNFQSRLTHDLTGHTAVIESIRFNSTGTEVLTGGSDNTARVYDASTGAALETLVADSAPIRDAGFGVRDTFIATTSNDDRAHLWAAPDPHPAITTTLAGGPAATVGFTSNGNRIVEASRSGRGQLFATRTLRQLAAFAAPPGDGFAGAGASRDGRLVAALAGPPTQGGAFAIPELAETFDASSGRLLATMRPSSHDAGGAITGTLDWAGDRILTADAGGAADQWDARTGRHLETLPAAPGEGAAQAVGYSRDDSLIAVAHTPPLPPVVTFSTVLGPATIDLWDARTGRRVRQIVGPSLQPLVPGERLFAPLSIAFSSNGRLIALAGADRSVEAYSTRDGTPVTPLALDNQFAVSLAFSPDDKYLAAGTAAGAYVWRLPSAARLPEFQHADPTQYVIGQGGAVFVGFTTDSRVLVTVGDLALEAWNPADHLQLFRAFAARGNLSLDGSELVTAAGSRLSLFPCELCGGLSQLLAVAKQHTTRGFTNAEKARFLNQG